MCEQWHSLVFNKGEDAWLSQSELFCNDFMLSNYFYFPYKVEVLKAWEGVYFYS